jgi:hypothetical protein
VTPLTWGQRLDIIDALCLVLDGVYAYLPLKRSLYGFDVIRGLEHLRQQVPTMTDLQFHRELTLLINRLRDAHTQYQGPWTVDEPIASLPFLVESYGPAAAPEHVVSKVDRRSVHDRHFAPGSRSSTGTACRSTGRWSSTPRTRPAAGPTLDARGRSSR